jgi:hypothetical protein
MVDELPALEPAAAACLERARLAVLNVLVVVGAGIALSGWPLGRFDRGASLWDDATGRRVAYMALLLLLVASRLVIRIGASRSALADPSFRAVRFVRAHVASAVVGGLAVPIGFAYGWAVQPRLQAVSPFWVVALASGFLAMPREQELSGFDQPMPDVLNAEAE